MVTSAFTHAALAGINASSVTPGCANEQAELYKKRKYAPHQVTPIIFEAHGRIGADTLTFLQKLCATLPETEQCHMFHYAIQQVSTTLQLYNAITLEAHARHHLAPHQQQSAASMANA